MHSEAEARLRAAALPRRQRVAALLRCVGSVAVQRCCASPDAPKRCGRRRKDHCRREGQGRRTHGRVLPACQQMDGAWAHTRVKRDRVWVRQSPTPASLGCYTRAVLAPFLSSLSLRMQLNAVRNRSHYICRSRLHFSYRAALVLCLPEALHAGGVQASRPSRGRALTESRLSRLRKRGKSMDVEEV